MSSLSSPACTRRWRAATLAAMAMGLGIVGSALADHSQEDRLDTPAVKACLKATDVEADMRDCYDTELTRQDAVLNVTYKDVMAQLGAAQKTELRLGERAWIKHRDKVCDPNAFPDEGDAYKMVDSASCAVSETESRILYLRKLEGR